MRLLILSILFLSNSVQADTTQCRDAYRNYFQAYLNEINNGDWAHGEALGKETDQQHIYLRNACYKKLSTKVIQSLLNNDPESQQLLKKIEDIEAQEIATT
ncbi:MAG: hypothetical protein DIZ80_13135 [endosymbiont of Galathealinum brachiosum]|uniref:Uncharacterized protein n=1 Tax=endosymbiont of Galathealinum brachiosum TaxID=2200906 RepID=A0A370D816_9GAMM|nr:MAG: hypothetical protein DIZ80_13135 [endosymbiont of Galathealinum brachiosum]